MEREKRRHRNDNSRLLIPGHCSVRRPTAQRPSPVAAARLWRAQLDGESLFSLEASSFRKRCQVRLPESSALVRREDVGEELEAAVSRRADGVDDPRDGGWGLSTYLVQSESESQPVIAVVLAQQVRPEAPRPVGWPRCALAKSGSPGR
jgi:hypothetical protein